MDDPGHVAAHLARNLGALRHARALTQEALARSGFTSDARANDMLLRKELD